eukprot:TRINITY_DN10266_c0_g1_i1.p1 TRINITY_DN10266_c0_g1~~TRINITY_DN10266_c0_g1_i1.p1  ORF type:complete len:403 (-),score=74.27 TRINITY_DN10266_c0_g1_i1:167-1375(-)
MNGPNQQDDSIHAGRFVLSNPAGLRPGARSNSLSEPQTITLKTPDMIFDELLSDLDLVVHGPAHTSFYGGKGASFEKLQQLGGIVKITAQLRKKNGDLLQLLPHEAPQLEAMLTVCDNLGQDVMHADTMDLGKFPDQQQFTSTFSSARSKRTTHIRVPFQDEKGLFTPLITFPSFALEIISSQITTHLMKIKVAVTRVGYSVPSIVKFSQPFEVKNFRGPEMNAKAKAKREHATIAAPAPATSVSPRFHGVVTTASDLVPAAQTLVLNAQPMVALTPPSDAIEQLSKRTRISCEIPVAPFSISQLLSPPASTGSQMLNAAAAAVVSGVQQLSDIGSLLHGHFVGALNTVQRQASMSDGEKAQITAVLYCAQNILTSYEAFADDNSFVQQVRQARGIIDAHLT